MDLPPSFTHFHAYMIYRYTDTHTHTGSYTMHLHDLSPKNNNKKHLPRSQRALATSLQPRCVLEERLDIRNNLVPGPQTRIVHTAINRRTGTRQGSIWDSCLQPAAGRKTSRERRLFFVMRPLLHAWLEKKHTNNKRGGGTS